MSFWRLLRQRANRVLLIANLQRRYEEHKVKRDERLLIDLLNRMKKVAGSK